VKIRPSNQVNTLTDSAFFEKYGQSFDPQTGHGGFEIWLPIKQTSFTTN